MESVAKSLTKESNRYRRKLKAHPGKRYSLTQENTERAISLGIAEADWYRKPRSKDLRCNNYLKE